MVSFGTFKTLGYFCAIFGIFGSIFRLVSLAVLIEIDKESKNHSFYYYQNILSSLVTFVFFMIFLAGIHQKNLFKAKIFRVFLIISGVLAQFVIIGYIGFTIFYEQKTEESANFTLALLVGLAIFTGLFLLFLWIVNGVIKYIEHGQEISATESNPTDADHQQKIVKYEAVLTRF